MQRGRNILEGKFHSSRLPRLEPPKLSFKEFKKCFSGEVLKPISRTQEEVVLWRKQNKIALYCENQQNNTEEFPDPVLSFSETNFGATIKSEIKKAGFTEPTAIQAQGSFYLFRQNQLTFFDQDGQSH